MCGGMSGGEGLNDFALIFFSSSKRTLLLHSVIFRAVMNWHC